MNERNEKKGDAMRRREFIKTGAALAAASLADRARGGPRARPNIIYVFTDQQHSRMMSCAGNKCLKTPALDYLAANGVRFARAYAGNPVCVPSRISMMTGHLPGEFGARENGSGMRTRKFPKEVLANTLGRVMARAGYELAYGGKVHLPAPLAPRNNGFTILTGDQRDGLAAACAEFIKRKHTKPFFLVASFINPHDICYMAITDFKTKGQFSAAAFEKGTASDIPPKPHRAITELQKALRKPEGVSEEEFFAKLAPPLPPNHLPQKDEPGAIGWLISIRPFRKWARENYTERQWRLHRWAYCRLTERVDGQLQVILDALQASGLERDTVVIFSSDHGDNDSAHKLEHKTVFYEESACIPLIIMQKGVTPGGSVDSEHLVSNGLDLLPTVCDYAGVEPPEGLRGRSLRPLAEGRKPADWREHLAVEDEIGRMVLTTRYKYMLHDRGSSREQLLDLELDPGETRNFAGEASHAEALASLRRFYRQWFG